MGARGGRWPLAASLAAVLVGVAAIGVGMVAHAQGFSGFGIGAERPAASSARGPSAPGDPSPRPPAAVGSAESGAAAPGASGSGSDPGAGPGLDPDWVARVAASARIPARVLTAYAEAAERASAERPGCGLGWNTLAGIGFVESEHGTVGGSQIGPPGVASPRIVGIALDGSSTAAIPDTDGGALDGDAVWDRAVGPMQFIPSTWAVWGSDGNGDGLADPQHIDDAAYSAARYLCSAGDLRDPGRWIAAVAAYNDTVDYNNRVAEAAGFYARVSAGG